MAKNSGCSYKLVVICRPLTVYLSVLLLINIISVTIQRLNSKEYKLKAFVNDPCWSLNL